MRKEPYRFLVVEDLPSDAYLIQREIRKEVDECMFIIVDTKEEYVRNLTEFNPDIILSDFSLPGFDWLTAFNIARESKPETPFIVVSGSTNAEIAAKCIEEGVKDFVSKKNIKMLGPVIQRFLPQIDLFKSKSKLPF